MSREMCFVVETISEEKGPEWWQDDSLWQSIGRESVHPLQERNPDLLRVLLYTYSQLQGNK